MDTLVPLLETVVVALLAVVSWRILAATPQGNAVALAVLACSLAAGSAVAVLAWVVTGLCVHSPLVRLAACAAAVPLAFLTASILLTAYTGRHDVAGRLARRFPLRLWTSRLLNLAGAAALWTGALVLAIGWATLAGVSPLRQVVQERSVLLRHLLPPAPGPATDDRRQATARGGRMAPATASPAQGQSPMGPGSAPLASLAPASGPVGLVARLLGAVEVANWLLCAQDVARLAGDLGHAERLLALRRIPALRRMAENSRLRALVEDRQIRALAAQCLAGDPAAIARVAENEKVTALLTDEEFRAEVRALDLPALREELSRVHLPATRLQPESWQVAAMGEEESLDDGARDDRRWRVGQGGCVLVWPANTHRAAAIGSLRVAGATQIVVYLDTVCPAVLRVNGQALELTAGPYGQLATADIPPGESVLSLEVTWPGNVRTRATTVEVFAEPLDGASRRP